MPSSSSEHSTQQQVVLPFKSPSKKLSIYPTHDEDHAGKKVMVESSSDLESTIRETRHIITNHFKSTHDAIQNVMNQWIQFESNTLTTLQYFKHPQEKYIPGLFFMVISSFAGSIMARNKNIFLKTISPIAFAELSIPVLFPKTSLKLAHTYHLIDETTEKNWSKWVDKNLTFQSSLHQ